MRAILLSAVAALFVAPVALAAQAGAPSGPSVPTGAPGQNPYAHPDGVDARDLSLSAAARTALDEREADRRAAELARHGGRAVPAKPADIIAQAPVSDSAGQPIGTIESVEADGAIVATATGRAKIPLDAFGKNKTGLLLGITRHEFEALVAKANAQPAG